MTEQPTNGHEISRAESGWKAAELIELFRETLGNCSEFQEALFQKYFDPNKDSRVRFLRNGCKYEVSFGIRNDNENRINPNEYSTKWFGVSRHSPLESDTQTEPVFIDVIVSFDQSWGTIAYKTGEAKGGDDTDSNANEIRPNTIAAVESVKTFVNTLMNEEVVPTPQTQVQDI